ncbi:MAG TPA: hypothetical protein VMN79_06765 [Casimicrobiaceae bacterium]|nr:hypothetical protein [Casimicrobiaceae bacterium]
MRFMRLTLQGALDRLQANKGGRRRGFFASRAAWLALGVVLAGCAGIRVDSSPDEKQKFVAQRAEARWNLLIKGDVAGAYEYLSAGSKAATPLDQYKARIRPGSWRQAKAETVDCEAEVCKVTMAITYDAKRMKGIETPLMETWIIEKGSAWYVFR